MARETTKAGKLGRLQRFLGALNANSAELPHLDASLTRFGTLLTQVEAVAEQQASFTAGKQEATKQFRTLLAESERLGNVLILAVKQHYGIRAEKLSEFGLQPFRGRTRKAKPAPQEPPAPSSPSPENPTPPPADAQ